MTTGDEKIGFRNDRSERQGDERSDAEERHIGRLYFPFQYTTEPGSEQTFRILKYRLAVGAWVIPCSTITLPAAEAEDQVKNLLKREVR